MPGNARLGKVSAGTIFRGETPGDRIGPFVSQFLWLEVPYGIARIPQAYRFPTRNQQFLTAFPEWLACQRGQRSAAKLAFDATPRFISSFRELAEYVHQDFSFQPYLNAALIALQYGPDALSPMNPYRTYREQSGDITFGNKNILTMLAQAALIGQKGAWYQKWLIHRRLRPEAFGARVELQATRRRAYGVSNRSCAATRLPARSPFLERACCRSRFPRAVRRIRPIRRHMRPPPARALRS